MGDPQMYCSSSVFSPSSSSVCSSAYRHLYPEVLLALQTGYISSNWLFYYYFFPPVVRISFKILPVYSFTWKTRKLIVILTLFLITIYIYSVVKPVVPDTHIFLSSPAKLPSLSSWTMAVAFNFITYCFSALLILLTHLQIHAHEIEI